VVYTAASMFALDDLIAVTCASVLAAQSAYLSSLPDAEGRAAWQAYLQAFTTAMTGYLFLDALGRRREQGRGVDSTPAGNASKDSEARAKYSEALAELEIELGERYICNLLRKELASYYAEYERYRKGRIEAEADGDGDDGDDGSGGGGDDVGDDGSDDNEDSAEDDSASDEASDSESEMPELIDPLSEPGTRGYEAAEKELTDLTPSSP